MKKNKMAIYAPFLSDLITNTNKVGEEMSHDYDPLEDAVANNDYSSIDLASTKDTFQKGTDKYKEFLSQLDNVDVPAKELGRHSILKEAYADYVKGCQDMVDSIKADTIEADAFNEAGKLQQDSIERVFKTAQKIMMSM
ncbi:hypothetical protein [Apilactobacillus zhangqiuensis]|uniref:hypothetical protein n=1 Tax=Apilactobacillus zhangqiuensis TaxID=2841031 RepID=UPI0006CE7F45|nr:hypothetical protein [Apilactobacillus zhangqiuensis]KPN79933.1 Uncharacterized protein RZ56_07900 [Apilactobacillus kunkeei]